MNTLVALCAIGAEKILGNEIKHLGYKLAGNAPGRVSFFGDDDSLFKANLCLRTADRVFLQLASYDAFNFDELFDGAYKINWQDFLKKDSKIVVDKVRSNKSKLNSEHSIQTMVHKAIYSKLGDIWHMASLPETGEQSDIRIYLDFHFINEDIALTVALLLCEKQPQQLFCSTHYGEEKHLYTTLSVVQEQLQLKQLFMHSMLLQDLDVGLHSKISLFIIKKALIESGKKKLKKSERMWK